MVNRELIRAKVVQLIYAYYLSENKSLDVALKEVEVSLSKANDLYFFLLSLIVVITREERIRYNLLCQKAIRESSEFPSIRFADNRFALQLEENIFLQTENEKHKYDWNEDIEFVRRLCDVIEQTEAYQEYLTANEDNYASDREIWRKLYKQIITDNDELNALLEEKSLYWNDDKDIVDTFILKTIKRFDPNNGKKQKLLTDRKDSSEVAFAQRLFCATIKNKEEYQRYVEQASQNWDLGRMPFIDMLIMQIAIAEMIEFEEIPINVTINEYVELSKVYSTPKSATFINAMLDSIAYTLKKEGKILK